MKKSELVSLIESIVRRQLNESILPNKNDKYLLYRLPSNSPSPGHGEYLYATGNTLSELFDNWLLTMKQGGYGYRGTAEIETQRNKFNKLKEKYWNDFSFYKCVKNKNNK